MARLLSKLDQESVEEAAPEWMTKRPDSEVNVFIRAVRTLIYNGELRVNSPGSRVKPAEQAKLLKMVLSNCKIGGASLTPTYRKPFDLIFARAKNEE